MKTIQLGTVGLGYGPDESGAWRGHWIGLVWASGDRRLRNIRGLSFASRRRGRIRAFWIDSASRRERRAAP